VPQRMRFCYVQNMRDRCLRSQPAVARPETRIPVLCVKVLGNVQCWRRPRARACVKARTRVESAKGSAAARVCRQFAPDVRENKPQTYVNANHGRSGMGVVCFEPWNREGGANGGAACVGGVR